MENWIPFLKIFLKEYLEKKAIWDFNSLTPHPLRHEFNFLLIPLFFLFSLPYEQIFGGAGSFSREHFKLINGFSNKFWGWGGEDDDLYNRYIFVNQSEKSGLKTVSGSYILAGYYNHSLPLDATVTVHYKRNCPIIDEHVLIIFVAK